MVIRAVGDDDEARNSAREKVAKAPEPSADPALPGEENRPPQIEIDPTVPNVARGYDYLLGGDYHFEVDRSIMHDMAQVYDGGIDAVRAHVRSNRGFLVRVVNFLVKEAGVRQFLDIGTGIPNADNVHGAAQQAAPECRIVYVDHDPVVLAYSHRLLKSTPEGATAFLYEDFLDPQSILDQAANTLDFTKPIALMLVSVLHSIADHDAPHTVVAQLMDALPSGSYLATSHFSSEIQPEAADAIRFLNERLPHSVEDRSAEQIKRFYDGTELVEPGLVQVDEWHREGEKVAVPGGTVPPWYGAVGRKP